MMMWLTRATRDRRLRIALVCCVAVLLVAWPRASQNTNRPRSEPGPGGKEAAAGEVLVKFRPGHNEQNVASAELEADAEPAESVGHGEVRLLRSRSKNVIDLVNVLSRRGDVEYAEPNYIVHATVTPNDPQFGQVWGLLNTGQTIGGVVGAAGADIHATSAWNVTTGSRANVVAVIDTGIDYTHPDLAANVWTAPAAFSVTIAGRTITCPAGTTHGFNAILNTCNPADDNNHGTHVSGTIGAVGNNGTGVAGVNWTASIMAGKFLDATGSGSLSDAINAIEFAIQAKAIFGAQANVRVLSNSWGGGGFSQTLMDEIAKANANDMLFVAAAGNNGTNNDTMPAFPSNYDVPNVVAVAATDNRDGIASFSDFGPTTVHLGAPGVNILSTIRGGGFSRFSGTSMATPHVSGAAALMLSACTLGTADLKATLLSTVDHVASLATRTITGGRLNVSNAINTCAVTPPAPATPSAPTLLSPTSDATPAQPVTFDWTDVTAATSYEIQVDDSSTFTAPLVVDQTVTPSQFTTGGFANVRHWWRVRGINSAGTAGSWSTALRFQPMAAPAAAALSAIALSPTSVVGGNPAQGTATLTSAAPTGGAVVTLSSSNTAVATVASVTVAAGATSTTFNVTTTAVSGSTPVTITGAYGGATKTATLTVTAPPPPASLSAASVSPTSVTGGTSAQGTVTLTSAAPAGGLGVTLSSNHVAATVPASVTVAAGATSATFTIATASVTASTVATITASAAGVTRTAALTVAPPAATATLTVTATGRSGERVTSSPAGINMAVGSTGSAPFTTGTSITLTISNGRDAIWSGACSSGGSKAKTCTFTLTGTATLTANVQ